MYISSTNPQLGRGPRTNTSSTKDLPFSLILWRFRHRPCTSQLEIFHYIIKQSVLAITRDLSLSSIEVVKMIKGLTALIPEMDCDQSAMGLPHATSEVSISYS
jgi:hypothetical protein